jgi:hypothetical protein
MVPYTNRQLIVGKHAVVVNPIGETFTNPPRVLMCISAGNIACRPVNSAVDISIVGAAALDVVPLTCQSVGASTGVWAAIYD